MGKLRASVLSFLSLFDTLIPHSLSNCNDFSLSRPVFWMAIFSFSICICFVQAFFNRLGVNKKKPPEIFRRVNIVD